MGRNALLRATLMGERKHGESSGWPTLSKHTPLTLEMYPRKKKSKARHRGVYARMLGMALFTAEKWQTVNVQQHRLVDSHGT